MERTTLATSHLSPSHIDAILKHHTRLPPCSALQTQQSTIDRLFGHNTLKDILMSLQQEAHDDTFAKSCLKALATKSPTSLYITFALMKKAQGQLLPETLQTDFLLVQKFCQKPDFFEGIRATIIDKDNCPNWHPKRLEDISQNIVEEYFNSEFCLNLFN